MPRLLPFVIAAEHRVCDKPVLYMVMCYILGAAFFAAHLLGAERFVLKNTGISASKVSELTEIGWMSHFQFGAMS
ncbi:hypothetical protein [Rhodoferax sp.]|uniref:hypothetical protein n=1 Tax=Rhodoferax sp. TaxID=50421 RepID=UPI002ACED7E9|nr:hypothetical protein [Rhodoferax sp.]MDZ7920390.1 hypothetical protein [Rhodoferax sp.]